MVGLQRRTTLEVGTTTRPTLTTTSYHDSPPPWRRGGRGGWLRGWCVLVVNVIVVVVFLQNQLALTEAWLVVSPLSSSSIVTPTSVMLQQLLPPPFIGSSSSSALQRGVTQWLASSTSAVVTTAESSSTTPPPPPSSADIQLLRDAMAEFYGVQPRDLHRSLDLLTQVLEQWQNQPDDERAGLYRVRGDNYLALKQPEDARNDYDRAVQLLSPAAASSMVADPQEFTASLLGRARAAKIVSMQEFTNNNNAGSGSVLQVQRASQAADDYRQVLLLLGSSSSDDDDDMDAAERLEEGAVRNPYAAWEWGDALRLSGRYRDAAVAHALASTAFEAVGDPARAVVALTDAGIDYASAAATTATSSNSNNKNNVDEEQAIRVLQTAIQNTKGVEGRDLDLLRRVVRKEGEGRMALAATLWTRGDKGQAEQVMGDACLRLDQLQAQMDDAVVAAAAKTTGRDSSRGTAAAAADPTLEQQRLLFSIDDDERGVGPLMDCSKFRNTKFVRETLGWPEGLQAKVTRLETLR